MMMEQIRAGEQVCATAKQQLAACEQQFQKVAHRAAEHWAKSAQPHLEQARLALNLRGDLQLQCEVTHTEQDNGLPMVTAEAKFFTEKRPSGYGGFTYADEVELNFEITLAQMAEDGDGVALRAKAMHGSTQQMSEHDEDACGCGSGCDCEGEAKPKSGPPKTTFTVGGAKPSPVKVPHENAGA